MKSALVISVRDNVATALRIVNTSFEMPLPVTSPPRSIICRLTPSCFRPSSTPSAFRAERNMRSSFGVMITSPGFRIASSAP